MAGHFDATTLKRIAEIEEIDIESRANTQARPHRTTIWVVVVGEDVYVRSVRGEAGKWYQQLRAHPETIIHAGKQRIPARAVPVTNAHTIASVSEAYLRKYARSPYGKSMTEAKTLPTTLRLEPR